MAMQSEFPDDPHATLAPSRRTATTHLPAGSVAEATTRWILSRAETVGRPAGSPAARNAARPMYRLIQQVGRGGMGEVWEAEQTSLHRIVAVKQLRPTADEDERERQRSFREEALTAARLDHPNIVPTYDLGEDEAGRPLLAMKLVRGTPWNRMIAEDFPAMAPEEFLARHVPILVDVAQAVAFAHARGIVHRDLKPHQVVVGSYGEVYLTDWGLAVTFDPERLAESGGGAEQLDLPTPINASSPAGTVAYMAPEQAQDSAADIGPWTDVFLLGATLYHLLAGRSPRSGKPSHELWKDAAEGIHTPLREAAAGRFLPDDLAALADRAMQARIRDRALTADQFLSALKEHLSGAGRRRESQQLAAEASRQLAGAATYREFGDAMALASRARLLWPGNAAAGETMARAAEMLSRAALRNGDLVLARAEAERLPDAGVRRDLESDIAGAEAAAAARERARRRALLAVAALVAVILLGGGAFTAALSRERAEAFRQRDLARANGVLADERAREAERERTTALRQMDGAIALSNFMMKDLASSLDLREPRDQELAEKITHTVLSQIDAMETATLAAESRMKLGNFLADVSLHLLQLSQPEEAIPVSRQAEALLRGLPGSAEELAACFATRSEALTKVGRFGEALAAALEGSAAMGGDPPPTILSAISSSYSRMGKLPEAEDYARRAVDKVIEIFGADSPEIAPSLLNYAVLLEGRDRFSEAEDLFLRGIGLLQGIPKERHNLTKAYNNLAVMYEAWGRREKVVETLRRTLDLAEQSLGPGHPDTQIVRCNLATNLAKEGAIAEAEAEFLKAKEALADAGLQGRRVAMRAAAAIGEFYIRIGRPEEALAEFARGKALSRELGIPESEDIGNILQAEGSALRALGRIPEAVEAARQALELRTRNAGPTHPDTLQSWSSYVAILDDAGRTGDAIAQLEARIAAVRARGLEQDPEIPESLYQLAILHARTGDFDKADTVMRRALDAFAAIGDSTSEPFQHALDNMATIATQRGDAAMAADCRRRIVELLEAGKDANDRAFAEWLQARVWHASVLRKLDGRGAEAHGILEDVVSMAAGRAPASAPVQLARGMALTYLERLPEAKAALEAAAGMQPDSQTAAQVSRFLNFIRPALEEAGKK